MRKIPSTLFLSAFLLSVMILASCDRIQERGIDQGAVRQEMAQREIRKLSPGEIMEGAMRQGTLIADACSEDLLIQLKKTLKTQGLKSAAELCADLRLPVIDSLSKHAETKVSRPRELPMEESRQPETLEEEILSAYRYNVEQELDLRPNVQVSGNNLLYTRPIVLNDSTCMVCHGEKASAEAQALMRSYDKMRPATGYEHGDLLGMWSILMKRKEVIQKL